MSTDQPTLPSLPAPHCGHLKARSTDRLGSYELRCILRAGHRSPIHVYVWHAVETTVREAAL